MNRLILKMSLDIFVKYAISLSFLLFFTITCVAQVYQGEIRDAVSGESLPYANFGIIGKNKGGISNELGIVNVDLSGMINSDSLMISYIGYKSKVFLVEDFDFSNSLIELSPNAYELQNIQVVANRKAIKIGHKINRFKGFTGWGANSPSEGVLRGTVIEASKHPISLKRLAVKIHQNTFDSVRCRIHIYEFENDQIGKQLLRNNIFFTTNQKGWVFVDVEKESIWIDKDFAVGIEWVDAWTDRPDFERHMLTIALRKSEGFFLARSTAHQNWGINTGSRIPAFYVEAFNYK